MVMQLPCLFNANALTSTVTILLTPTRNFSNHDSRVACPASPVYRHHQSQAAAVNQECRRQPKFYIEACDNKSSCGCYAYQGAILGISQNHDRAIFGDIDITDAALSLQISSLACHAPIDKSQPYQRLTGKASYQKITLPFGKQLALIKAIPLGAITGSQ